MCEKELNIETNCALSSSPPHIALRKQPGFIYTVVGTECTGGCHIYKSALIEYISQEYREKSWLTI